MGIVWSDMDNRMSGGYDKLYITGPFQRLGIYVYKIRETEISL